MTIAHYRYGEGISAHRDHLCYEWAVAICSLSGRAEFAVVGDKSESQIIDSFITDPGDLMVLGATGYPERPLHRVHTISDDRTSVSFRYAAAVAQGSSDLATW